MPLGQDGVNIWKYVSVVCLLILFFEHCSPLRWTANSSASQPDARQEPLFEDGLRRLRHGKPSFLEVAAVESEAEELLEHSSPVVFGAGVRTFLEDSLLVTMLFPGEGTVERPRLLSASSEAEVNATNSSSMHSSSHAEHHSHPQYALFFLFNAIIFGTVVLHLTTLPKLHSMQQTVCLFVLGVMYSLIQEGLNLKEDTGIFGDSYDMWMGIDPHLLLFSMLPALLAGDAMSIDTAVARTVAKQCVFLAGPGVLFGSFMTAFFLWVYLQDWDFLLCLVTGSILAATDPVAVVGLLKELGASPILTVQIQGESLLNDGTAIVLYGVAYDMLKGKNYDASDILIILVLVAVCAAGLGVVIGWIFFQWIKLASDRLDHHAGMLQTALTICCAYWSFCISEGVLHISGVLCTVFASLVLADRMWPAIVDKSSLLHIWHMIEYLGNTIIFFLAGALFGNTMVSIEFIDYFHLIVVYCVCTLIRAMFLFASRPLLKWLSEDFEPVSFGDACVMTWGGLRGAVGLALAIAVRIDKADGKIDDGQSKRVLFFVGGVASLTLCINATTCPLLVKMLGITKTPAARQRMLYKIYSQLFHLMMEDEPVEAVQAAVYEVLHGAKHHIDHLVPEGARKTPTLRKSRTAMARLNRIARLKRSSQDSFPCAADVCESLQQARAMYKDVVDRPGVIMDLLDVPAFPFEDRESELEAIIRENDTEETAIKSVNEAFLSLLRSQYWAQLDAGEFVGGVADAEMLLTSTSLAMKHAGCRLNDLRYLLTRLQISHEDTGAGMETILLLLDEEEEQEAKYGSRDWKRTLSTQGSRARIVSRKSSAVLINPTSARSSDICEQSQHTDPVPLTNTSETPEVSTSLPDMDRTLNHARINDALVQLQKNFSEKLQKHKPGPFLVRFTESSEFNILMCMILIGNSIFILIEQIHRDDSYTDPSWLIVEIIFTTLFLIEFIIKFAAVKCDYFMDAWNIFDFGILCLSVFGVIIEIAAVNQKTGAEVHKEARIFRLNRVFRILRIFRTFRLFKFFLVLRAKLLHKDFSLRLAEHLRTITACRAFIHAHIQSQIQMTVFFGEKGKITSCEEARCILESQTEIYKVIVLAVQEAYDVEEETIVGMRLLRDNIKVTGKLSEFVNAAKTAGVITAREADTISHPLHEHVRIFNLQMSRAVGQGEAPEPRFHSQLNTAKWRVSEEEVRRATQTKSHALWNSSHSHDSPRDGDSDTPWQSQGVQNKAVNEARFSGLSAFEVIKTSSKCLESVRHQSTPKSLVYESGDTAEDQRERAQSSNHANSLYCKSPSSNSENSVEEVSSLPGVIR